jgi:hypothetical protein
MRALFWEQVLNAKWTKCWDGMQIDGSVLRKSSMSWQPGGAGLLQVEVPAFSRFVAEIRVNSVYGGLLLGVATNECSLSDWQDSIGDATEPNSVWFYDTTARSFSKNCHQIAFNEQVGKNPSVRKGDTVCIYIDADRGEITLVLNRSVLLGRVEGICGQVHPAAFLFADGTELEVPDTVCSEHIA